MTDTAFGPDSVARGGTLPAAGRDLMITHAGLPPGVLDVIEDGWLTPEVPVLVRGEARILPLAWRGDPGTGYNPYAEPAQAVALASQMKSTAHYRTGSWTAMDLSDDRTDSIGSYLAALRASGATSADHWVFLGDGVGVALVWAGHEDAGDLSLAAHVVPESWLSERVAAAPVSSIDVSWSWADVVELYRARVQGH